METEMEKGMKQADLQWEWAEVIRSLDNLHQVEANFQGRRVLVVRKHRAGRGVFGPKIGRFCHVGFGPAMILFGSMWLPSAPTNRVMTRKATTRANSIVDQVAG